MTLPKLRLISRPLTTFRKTQDWLWRNRYVWRRKGRHNIWQWMVRWFLTSLKVCSWDYCDIVHAWALSWLWIGRLERKSKDWLYPVPGFFNWHKPYGPIKDEEKVLDHHIDVDLEDHPDDGLRVRLKAILVKGIESGRGPKLYGRKENISYSDWTSYIVDVGKHTRDRPHIDIYDAEDLDKHLSRPRTPEKAKKRFQ